MRLRFWRLSSSLLLLILTCISPLAPAVFVKAAADPSPWMVSALPSLNKIADLTPSELDMAVKTINRDCQLREVVTRLATPLQPKQSVTGCVTDTGYGAVYNGQSLQRPGSTIYGTVLTSSGGTVTLIPIPYSPTGLVLNGGNYNGSYLSFITNMDSGLNSSAIYTGEAVHKLPSTYSASLRDVSGQLLTRQTDTISFSSSGNWMVVDLPGIGTARINTENYSVLPFGDAVNYNIGLGPAMRTTISPDGRFAAVASKNFEIFKLYDLSTCGPVPSLITAKVTCSSRDLLPFIRGKIAGFSSILRMRFRSDYTLDMDINSTQNNILVTSRQVLLAAGQAATNFDYLALGDSFASGEGAYQYKAATDTTENKCHLSQRSYPYLISQALGYGQHESVACSGAKIEDVTSKERGYKGQVKDGLTRQDRDVDLMVSNLNPGYIGQIEFSDHYQPNVITLSASGNDIGFSDKIKRCLSDDTCYQYYEDRLEIVNEINAQFYRLTDMYNQVRSGTGPQTKLYVIGYPQIADPSGNCAANVHLNHDEIIFSQQLISYLNSVIKAAAANAGAFYVDTEDAFAGHKLCETDSWNVAVNGLTAGNDIVNLPLVHGPVGNESFHPTAFGQELLKTTVLQRTNNFAAAMPAPNPSATIPAFSAGLPILQAPKSNRTVRLIMAVTGASDHTMQPGQATAINFTGLAPFIRAGSSFHAWLNSDPVDLGAFSTDPSGNATVLANLPLSVPVGFHTLHLYGKNTIDQDVDLYQTVYVSAGGNPNQCGGIALSGQDTDKDNIDDACDGFIDQPPVVAITPDPAPTPPADTTPPTQSIDPPQPSPTDPPANINPLPISPPVPGLDLSAGDPINQIPSQQTPILGASPALLTDNLPVLIAVAKTQKTPATVAVTAATQSDASPAPVPHPANSPQVAAAVTGSNQAPDAATNSPAVLKRVATAHKALPGFWLIVPGCLLTLAGLLVLAKLLLKFR